MDTKRIGAGIAGGLAGGLLFGVMMQAMGVIPMIGGLVGQETVAVGWVVHLLISAFLGALYGLTAGALRHDWARAAGYGLLYGAVWWVLGPLLIMPLWMGMPVFEVGEPQVMSLVGHLLFGLVTGLVFTAVVSQSVRQPATSR